MRIVFLCSSLEPGRDGVGDYVRTLAAELERSGHACLLIALHDRWLNATAEDAAGLRLSASTPSPERERLAGERIERFDPDWVSLQFVPYGFHDKGLVFGLSGRIAALTRAYRLHIMFHELWIGDATSAPWKQRLVGRLQRALIQRLLRKSRPACITTSNALYQRMLAEAWYEAARLPLFGNIPIVSKPERAWLDEALRAAGVPAPREACWVFVFFGMLHPEWEPEPLFTHLRRAAVRAGKKVVLLAVGRLGSGEALWVRLARAYGDAFHFVTLGEQPAHRVSEVLHAADAGVAASPWELMGKSSSAASMYDHGVPIIVTRHASLVPAREHAAARYLRCDDSLGEKLVRGLPRHAPVSPLPAIAAQFVKLLGPASAPVGQGVLRRKLGRAVA